MYMKRKIGILAMTLLLALANASLAFASQGTTTAINGEEGRLTPEEEAAFRAKYENVKELKYPGKGFAYDASPSLDGNNNKKTDEQIKNMITDVSKLLLTPNNGTLYLENESKWAEDQQLVSAEKTTLPESKIATVPYTQKWNGIHNFYFPNTYYSEGSFTTTADNAYRVKIYAIDGTYAGTIDAVPKDGKYVTDVAVKGGEYYIVIFNASTNSTTGASYTIK